MRSAFIIVKEGDAWAVVLAGKAQKRFASAEQAIAAALDWADAARSSGRRTQVIMWDEDGKTRYIER